MEDIPEIGSVWRHYNGVPYTVLFIANELDTPAYPICVVYQGPNGGVWVRKLSDWHRSFTLVTPVS